MPIVTGSNPKALRGAPPVAEQRPDGAALTAVASAFVPKERKPPKLKKRAFGPAQHGAAFKK